MSKVVFVSEYIYIYHHVQINLFWFWLFWSYSHSFLFAYLNIILIQFLLVRIQIEVQMTSGSNLDTAKGNPHPHPLQSLRIWPQKITIFDRRYIFKWLFFCHCHIGFPKCTYFLGEPPRLDFSCTSVTSRKLIPGTFQKMYQLKERSHMKPSSSKFLYFKFLQICFLRLWLHMYVHVRPIYL